MSRCRTCEFWIQPAGDLHPKLGACTVGRIGQRWLTGVCSETEMDGVHAFAKPEEPHTLIDLRTGPDFGCVHHRNTMAAAESIPVRTLDSCLLSVVQRKGLKPLIVPYLYFNAPFPGEEVRLVVCWLQEEPFDPRIPPQRTHAFHRFQTVQEWMQLPTKRIPPGYFLPLAVATRVKGWDMAKIEIAKTGTFLWTMVPAEKRDQLDI